MKALLGGVLLCVAASSADAKLVGKDSRSNVPEAYKTIARGVGVLKDTKRNKVCTAFCVAPDAIATNAHCLAWLWLGKKKHKWKDKEIRSMVDFSFRLDHARSRLAFQKIEPLGNPFLSILTVWPKKTYNATVYNDWAVARLRKPVCWNRTLKLARSKVINRMHRKRGVEVIMIGWPTDRRYRQSFEKCWMQHPKTRYGNTSGPHSCDSYGGASGSPILTRTKAGWRVIAIHRGAWFYKKRGRRFGPKARRSYKRVNAAVSVKPLTKLLPGFLSMTFPKEKMTMQELQKLLQRGRVLKGRINGKVSERVRWAIKRYQNRNDMVPISIPTEAMIEKLRGAKF